MTDKQLIRQEIERLINDKTDGRHVAEADITAPKRSAYLDILNFIDSLPEEPASEDLEKEIEIYSNNVHFPICYDDYKRFARHFAEWQRRQDEKLFKDDSWNYIEENYPNISQEEKLRLYDISIKSRLAGANTIKQKMKKTTQTEYEKGERGNEER